VEGWLTIQGAALPVLAVGNYHCHGGHGDSALHFFSVLGKITVLGEVMDGDVLLLHLTGNMKEELGGTPIFGEDVVLIIGK
jgi:hypothetical protein